MKEIMINVFSMKYLPEEVKRICQAYLDCCAKVERREEGGKLRSELESLCLNAPIKLDINDPSLLLALMDAYEITRNEKMLQQVLDVVSQNVDQMKVSTEGVKLLAYCYYYVEEEECAVKAREMLKELKRRGEHMEELAEVEKIVEELI